MNLYDVLGIDENASQDDIKDAYRKMAQRNHPDKKGGNKEIFQSIQEAYSVLSDPEKRAHYDSTGEQSTPGPTQRDEAITMISTALQQVILNFNPERFNILKEAEDTIMAALAQMNEHSATMNMRIRNVQIAIKRTKARKGKQDMLSQLLTSIGSTLDTSLVNITSQIAIINIALGILHDHEYMCDLQASGCTPIGLNFIGL